VDEASRDDAFLREKEAMKNGGCGFDQRNLSVPFGPIADNALHSAGLLEDADTLWVETRAAGQLVRTTG